jgi:hypothetical protein
MGDESENIGHHAIVCLAKALYFAIIPQIIFGRSCGGFGLREYA